MPDSTARLHHETEGPRDAPAVVLAPSLGTTLGMWDAQVPALAERFRVVRYNHRGHAGSAVPPGPYSVADLGHDVLALLDELRLDRVLFGGVSLGGMVGMWLAAHAPQRIERLALCCTSAHMPPAQGWAERAESVRRRGTAAAVAGDSAARWFTPGFRGREPAAVERAVTMLRETPDEGYAGCCEAIGGMDLRGDLAAIRAPTLVIAGADDPATPPEHARTIAADVTGARVEVLDGASHLAAMERPEAVTGLVLDHFTQ